MLPSSRGHDPSSLRFGDSAIHVLVERLVGLGCRKAGLKAKLFGGASVLQALEVSGAQLAQQNIEVARRLLLEHGIRVVLEQTGGRRGRKLIFNTDDGVVWLKEL